MTYSARPSEHSSEQGAEPVKIFSNGREDVRSGRLAGGIFLHQSGDEQVFGFEREYLVDQVGLLGFIGDRIEPTDHEQRRPFGICYCDPKQQLIEFRQ